MLMSDRLETGFQLWRNQHLQKEKKKKENALSVKREEVLCRLCRCSSCQIRLCIDVALAAEVLIQIAPKRLMLNKPDKDFPHRKETLIHFESYCDFE